MKIYYIKCNMPQPCSFPSPFPSSPFISISFLVTSTIHSEMLIFSSFSSWIRSLFRILNYDTSLEQRQPYCSVYENLLSNVGHLSCMNWLHVGHFAFMHNNFTNNITLTELGELVISYFVLFHLMMVAEKCQYLWF